MMPHNAPCHPPADPFTVIGSNMVRAAGGGRSAWHAEGLHGLRDGFAPGVCLFIHIEDRATLRLSGDFRLQHCAAGGWLLRSHEASAPSYWLPVSATLRRLDRDGHILEERIADLCSFELSDTAVSAAFIPMPEGWPLDATIWQLNDPALIKELQSLAPIETQGYFLLGSHTRYSKPADLYRHLIHGWVYEDRYAWPHKRKICSENDAHALYLLFCGLEKATGKTLYRLFKQQLLLSVLSRQSADGAFRHGEWAEHMEAHYRLNASALHLMLDSLAEAPDASVKEAADKLADFLAAQTDNLKAGTWFLHDELEHSEAAMNETPFRWVRSRALGKSPSNMLVLNTQIDTSVGLARHAKLTASPRHEALLASAAQATQSVLAMDAAPWLYRPLMKLVALTLLPTERAERLPPHLRALKRLAWKYLLPRLPDIKSRFPRLVMPGGYIDRELSLRTWAHHYLSINLMDLARYRRMYGDATLDPIIHAAARFTAESGILERWAELRYEKYALGFWAEALYHLCRIYPAHENYRTWMILAVLLLEATKQGLPPSLLGANAEAVAPSKQLPCPIPVDGRLRIINLGDRGRPELLVVNPTDQALPLAWHTPPDVLVAWPGDVVPPRGSLLGRAP